MLKYLSGFFACTAALFLTACFPFNSGSADEPQAETQAAVEAVEAASPADAPAKVQPAPLKKETAVQKGKTKASKSAPAAKKPVSEATARAELDKFLVHYTNQANRSMNGSRAKPKVTHSKGMYTARFTEIDPATVHADMRKSKSKHFDYVASMYYLEMTYECTAKTQKAALKGPFRKVGERKVTELPRYYKGKWEN